jgi:hypothetical protein
MSQWVFKLGQYMSESQNTSYSEHFFFKEKDLLEWN